jgi:hypothetical protein
MKSEYEEFYVSCMKTAVENNIDKETNLGKRRGRRPSIEVPQEDQYRKMYEEVLDTFVVEMDARFKEDNIKPLITIHKVITAHDVIIDYQTDLSIYKDDIDFGKLDVELNNWVDYKKENPLLLTCKISELIVFFDTLNLQVHFNEIFKLFKIYMSAAISSASGERSFSSLRLLKTYLRNSMDQQRISDLAVMCINSDIIDNLNVNNIIDKFASVKNRRMNLN